VPVHGPHCQYYRSFIYPVRTISRRQHSD